MGSTAIFMSEAGGVWTFIAVLSVCFFLASSGASAAYLTVSEIFPMETRALAIAFFYALERPSVESPVRSCSVR